MSEQLERIKATRRGNRGVITKYINEAKDLVKNSEHIDDIAKDRLNTMYDLLEEKLKVFFVKNLTKKFYNCVMLRI